MTVIVGIHGIANQQLGRNQLLNNWVPAVVDGLERAIGRSMTPPPFDIAFYGDLFLRTMNRESSAKAGASDDLSAWLDNIGDDELADLRTSAEEVVDPQLLSDVEKAAPAKGLSRLPLPLQALARALDRQFGTAAGVLYLGELRQVRRYLLDPKLKEQADERVRATTTAKCRVLIGHSLGSVVALEAVRQAPERELDLLLTLGSPLGLRMVRDRLPRLAPEPATGLPRGVRRWVNVRDLHDPVACAGSLAPWWPGVEDMIVDNESDAHSAERYLSKRVTGEVLVAALPELAP